LFVCWQGCTKGQIEATRFNRLIERIGERTGPRFRDFWRN
jgi:hypothetical protein